MSKNFTGSSVLLVRRLIVLSTATAAASGMAWADEPTRFDAIEVIAPAESAYVVKSAGAGTRTDTPVEYIPQSVVTVPGTMIEDQGSKTLSDALRNASNVAAMDERDANNVVFKIRGFHAATVVDGVAMPGYFPNQESLVNVERIDVLKGPSGALFGSSQGMGSYGTLGGVIAVTTAEPGREPVRQLGLKAGNYGEKGVSFDVNQPLKAPLAVRIAGEWSDSDSETDRVFFKKRTLFPSIAVTPNDDTRVVVRLRYLDSTTLDYSGQPVNGTLDTSTYRLPRSENIAAQDLPDTTNTSRGVNVQWSQHLDDAWDFSLLTAYNEAEVDQRGTWVVDSFSLLGCFDYGNVTATVNTMCGARMWDSFRTVTVSPSLTGKFQSGETKHTVNVGIDYENTHDDAYMLYSNAFGPVSFDNVDLTDPVYPAWSEPVAPGVPDQQNRYTSTVAYVQDQVDLERWHFLGSLRYSKIEVTDVNPAFLVDNHSDNSDATPRIGAVYEFTPNVSVFAGYGEGIKVPTVSIFSEAPEPEESKQAEVGLRLRELAGVTATVALFDLTRENVAIADPLNPGFSMQAGEQRSRGVDADLRWRVNASWSWIAALTSQTAEITEDSNTALEGKQLFNVPEQITRLATRYDIRAGRWAGIGMGIGLSHNSELPGNSSNTFFTPATTVWDAQLSYSMRDARFGLNFYNLADKEYYVPSNYFGGNQVIPALPRTVTATASLFF